MSEFQRLPEHIAIDAEQAELLRAEIRKRNEAISAGGQSKQPAHPPRVGMAGRSQEVSQELP